MDPSTATQATQIISSIDVSPIVEGITGVLGVGMSALITILGIRKGVSFLVGLIRSA